MLVNLTAFLCFEYARAAIKWHTLWAFSRIAQVIPAPYAKRGDSVSFCLATVQARPRKKSLKLIYHDKQSGSLLHERFNYAHYLGNSLSPSFTGTPPIAIVGVDDSPLTLYACRRSDIDPWIFSSFFRGGYITSSPW